MTPRAAADSQFTDDELADLALACDPDGPLDPRAVPLALYAEGQSTLPQWYMPPPAARFGARRRWRAIVVSSIVVALMLIEAVGLCSTYGPVVHP